MYVFTPRSNERRLMIIRDLSSFAALVVVCSLAIGPFAQQLTYVEVDSQVTGFPASIPVSSSFSPQFLATMQAAMTSAFFGSPIPEMTSECPSGKCTWKPYQSLAVCHQCVDITDQIQYNYSCLDYRTVPCTASLANGLAVDLWPWPIFANGYPGMPLYPVFTRTNTSGGGKGLKLDNIGLSLVNFTKIYSDDPSLAHNHTWVDDGCYRNLSGQPSVAECRKNLRRALTAMECALHWCINRYSAAQEFGKLKESYIDSWWSHSSHDVVSLYTDDPSVADPYAVAHKYPSYVGKYIQLLPSDDQGSFGVLGQIHNQTNLTEANGTVSSQEPTGYAPCYVEVDLHYNLSLRLASWFTGTTSNKYDLHKLSDTQGVSPYLLSVPNEYGQSGQDPAFGIMSRVAFSLTQTQRLEFNDIIDRYKNEPGVRSARFIAKVGGLNQNTTSLLNSTALGTTFEDRIVIRVRWGWLALPVGLVATTILLTFATKIRSSKHDIPVWGSLTTVLIFRGPYSHIDGTLPLKPSTKQMQDKAKSTEVAFGSDSTGHWRLLKRKAPSIRSKNTDLESAAALLPPSTSHEIIEYPNSTSIYASSTVESPLATAQSRQEATSSSSSSQQRPRLTRSQSN